MFKKLKSFKPLSVDFAILIVRLGFGSLMALDHGWDKLNQLTVPGVKFVSYFGFSPVFWLLLTVFAEFFCSIFLALGLYTRFVLIPLIITMSVAVFQIHAEDTLNDKEHALLYLLVYVSLFLIGPGKYSVDAKMNK